MIKLLLMPCVILSLSNCTTMFGTRTTTDSFCKVYDPVVVNKGDGSIAAPPAVQRRILGNEQTYRGLCKESK